jgi:hypothetical protein
MTPPATAVPAVRRARVSAPARPLTVAPRPRRVSGPARRRQAPPSARVQPQAEGLAVGVISALRSVDGSPLLDRLIRGRAWIVLVAFALIGIVTLQLTLLKLNAGIGRALVQESALTRENAALNIENSERASGSLVESSAASLGMELVPAGTLRFLTPRPGADSAHAASALLTPVAGTTSTSTSGTTAAAGAAGSPSTASGEAAGSSGSQTPGAETASAETPSAATPGSEAGTGTSGAPASTTAAAPAASTSATESPTGAASAGTTPAGGSSSAGASETQATPAGGAQAQTGGAG